MTHGNYQGLIISQIGLGQLPNNRTKNDAALPSNRCLAEPTEIIEILLKAGADLSIQDWLGRTALHHAVSMHQFVIVQMLLDVGVRVSTQDDYGGTALHEAILTGNPAVIGGLLAAGVDTSLQDQEGRTALHLAVWHGKNELIDALVTGGAHFGA